MKKKIKIIEVDWDYQEKWDNFVDRSFNGTLFHKLSFLSYHSPDKFNYRFLTVVEGNQVIAVLACTINNGFLRSPVGSSYGGFAIAPVSFYKIYTILICLLDWARENYVKEIEFVHAPLVYNDRLSQELDFVLLYCGFLNPKNLFSSILDLSWFNVNDPLASFSPAGRRAVKKSIQEALTVEISDDVQSFYSILAENKAKFKVQPAHTLEELIKIKRLFPDFLNLFLVKQKQNLVGGVYTFHCNERVLLAFYIASSPKYQQLRPINRALFDVVLWACSKKYKYLDLGVSMNTKSDNPMEPAWSLISFKEHTGSKGYLRPYYNYRFVF